MAFKIYIRDIRRTDGSGGFSDQKIENLLNDMYEDFAQYNIFFEAVKQPIESDFIYSNTELEFIGFLDVNYGHGDGIDIFFFNQGAAGGIASNIPSLSLLVLGTELENFKILTHEMGHCLGLHHTWRGFEQRCPHFNPSCGGNPSDPNGCPEVPGVPNLGIACGDCVEDTPPDPWQWVTPGWQDCSYGIDCDAYYVYLDDQCNIIQSPPGFNNIDVSNIMSYYRGYSTFGGPVDCRDHFTPGQIERVRKVLLYNEYEYGGNPSNGSPDYSFMQNALADKIVIRSDVIWDEPIEVCTDVYIKAPARLAIRSVVSIHQGVKFVVEPGAELRVDGGVMTDADDGYWKGIEVWGDASAPQIPATNQGKLIIKSDALIENAEEAIVAFNPNPENGAIEATTGGLVRAEGSRFVNNGRVAEFRKYGKKNYAYFSGCTFTMDDNFAGPLHEEHFKLEGVYGLSFFNCVFESTNTNPYQQKGIGIHSLDSRFAVTGPASRFEGIRRGVKAGNVASAEAFFIKGATFTNVELGILAIAANHFTVTDCTFELGSYPSTHPATHEGIQINHCTGFSVKDNTFLGLGPHADETVGVKVIDTGAGNDANTLYGNGLDALFAANAAIGDNQAGPFGGGIVYECNRNLGQNTFDFWVQEGGGITEGQQTADGLAAGNTFSQNGTDPDDVGDFNNQGSLINYFFWEDNTATDQEPIYFTDETIQTIGVSSANTCQGSPTGGEIPPEELPEVKNRFVKYKEKYDTTLAEYRALLDGGDTPGLLAEIASATPAQAIDVRNELSTYSPYVSRKALKALINRPEVFSNAIQVEVLEANPEAVRKGGFPAYLEQHSVLTPSELEAVLEASLLNTSRDSLEAALSAAYAGMHRNADLVLAYYMLDSTAFQTDSLLSWLGNKGSLHSGYLQSGLLMQLGQGETALEKLDAIPATYPMNENQQAAFENKLALSKLLLESPAGLWGLDSLQLDSLVFVAEGPGLGAIQAMHLLEYAYGFYFEPDRNLPAALEERSIEGPPVQKAPPVSIGVFPNPARESVTFRYSTPALAEAAIRLYGPLGRPVAEIPLQAYSRQVEYNVSTLPNGVYAYQLVIDGRARATGKILILH